MLFIDQLRANPNAQVTIDATGVGVGFGGGAFPGGSVFTAFITEDFGFGGSNSFNSALEAIMGSTMNGVNRVLGAGITMGNSIGTALGRSHSPGQFAARTINAGDSVSSWSYSARPAFGLNLLFIAIDNADTPMTIMRNLMALVYPTGATGVGILFAPLGYTPTIGGVAMAGCVSVTIGKWFVTPRIFLVKSVNCAISQRTDPAGIPLYVQASIQFEAARVMTYPEVAGFFFGP